MDIKQIKIKKRLLEEDISTLIEKFEADTGLNINDLNFDALQEIGKEYPRITRVTAFVFI